VTQVTAPSLTNDMRGTFLAVAWARGPSPLVPRHTHAAANNGSLSHARLRLRGEPELTLRELIDTLEAEAGSPGERRAGRWPDPQLWPVWSRCSPRLTLTGSRLGAPPGTKRQPTGLGQGLVWRDAGSACA